MELSVQPFSQAVLQFPLETHYKGIFLKKAIGEFLVNATSLDSEILTKLTDQIREGQADQRVFKKLSDNIQCAIVGCIGNFWG